MNELIEEYLAKDLIRVQKHPELNLRIINYSAKTQYEKLWDTNLLKCRGLILDGEANIVAHCLPKFFNLSELDGLNIQIPNESFSVFKKEDGSYIQLFYYQNRWIVSSKGSFTSAHVGWAWDIINKKYSNILKYFVENQIYLSHNFIFEIIHPDGRIVCDYGDKEDLILLCVIDNNTGEELEIFNNQDNFFGFPLVKKYDGITDYKILSNIIQNDEEGFVVRFKNGFRIKIKGQEYLRLHKLMTQLNSNHIFDAYCEKIPFTEFIEPFPDEMFGWIESIWLGIEKKLNNEFESLSIEYWRLNRELIVKKILNDKDVYLYFKKYGKKPCSLLMNYHKGSIDIKQILMNCKPKFEKCWAN